MRTHGTSPPSVSRPGSESPVSSATADSRSLLLPGISVVVPVYSSSTMLAELVTRLRDSLEFTGQAFELILVDDGSPDSSWLTIEALSQRHAEVVGLKLLTNYGQHSALLAGVREARFSTLVTLDDDLQNPPEEVPRLLERLHDGFDIVYGRPKSERHSVWRRVSALVTKFVLRRFLGAEMAHHATSFRAFRTDLRRGFETFSGPWTSLDVLLSWSTKRFGALEVEHRTRPHGSSNYNFWKLMTHATNMMTGFSVLPLRLASAIGFAFALFGFVVLLFVVGRFFLEGKSVPGFPFLASLMAIFSGAQLFALGVIGEYIGRMYLTIMDRPPYVIECSTRGK